MKATPMVAIVVQELPVSTDTNAHTPHVITRKNVGLSTRIPYSIRVGTTPLHIQVAAIMAMSSNSGTAGSICEALRRIPSRIRIFSQLRVITLNPSATAEASNSIK